MVLVPTAASKFLAIWQGPYTVVERVGLVTYRVRQPGRRRVEQIYHINLLKKWMAWPEELAAFTQSQPPVVDVDPQLSGSQKTELEHLVSHFSDVFSETPGRMTVLHHEIRTPPGVVARQQAYQIPEARRLAIEEEVKKMLELGIIEPSCSPWTSPIVMVPKPDNTLRPSAPLVATGSTGFSRLDFTGHFKG